MGAGDVVVGGRLQCLQGRRRMVWSVECGVWSVGSHSVLGTDPGQLCHNTPSDSSGRPDSASSSSSSVIDTKFNLNGNIEIFLILYQG